MAEILASTARLEAQEVSLYDAYGRTLADDLTASIDLPPFDNSSMDGYAVRAADTAQAPVTLDVVMDIPAGAWPSGTVGAGQAARIMTGAPLPQGADAIVPVEDTDSEWHAGDDQPLPARVTINSAVNVGAAVRRAGENIHAGQKVLPAGIVLRPQDIGMAASIGVGRVPVVRQPRAALLTTGDELASPDTPLAPGQIYDANSYTLAGLVQEAGAQPIVLPPARDSLESVRALFRDALAQQPDIIISSAGVSVGAADYVRVVLEEMGRVDFWRINLRPGKPLAYGHVQGIPFFGLPGNPVSAMVTFDVIVRPALLKMLGQRDTTPLVHAITAEPIESDGRRSYLRVTLERRGGQLVARLTGTQSSGALMSMVLADGLLIVPEGERFVPAGTELAVRLLRGQA